jgi:hypothetical protein
MTRIAFLFELDECDEAVSHVVDAETGQRLGSIVRMPDGSVGYWAPPGGAELLDVWGSVAEARATLQAHPELIRGGPAP